MTQIIFKCEFFIETAGNLEFMQNYISDLHFKSFK